LKKRSDLVLKAFLNNLEPRHKEELERFLPEKLPSFTKKMDIHPFQNENLLETVHWSWFIPTLKSYSEIEQKFFLSILPQTAAKNLAKELLISSEQKELTEAAKKYLKQILIQSLLGSSNRLLPADYLPPSPLQPLAHASKKELTRIIDFLSLYDLAAELRQIVETKILKKIYSLLSEEEKQFLKTAMAYKDHLVLNRMGLDRWDGSEETFRNLLHRRGLSRFAAALSGQDPDLVWRICHQLDIGRGNSLFKQCGKEAIHGVSDTIIRQIEELL
jgi:hypothetical protein